MGTPHVAKRRMGRSGRAGAGRHRGAAPARVQAHRALASVLRDGRSLDAAVSLATGGLDDRRDRALARELASGVLRWLPRLDAILAALLERPLPARELDVRLALLIGLYQILHTRVPDHAAVNETVSLVRELGKAWATGLANGALRALLRERERIVARAERTEEGRHAHPSWLVASTRDAWPQRWRRILQANNERAPMALRVNARRVERDAYLSRLAEGGIRAEPVEGVAHGVVLDAPCDVAELPGFGEGMVSVQDAAAQLAAPLLAPAPGDRVLDACAAPGGKSAHLLELQPECAELVALDVDAARLERLRTNLARLGLRAQTRIGDARDPRQWWDARPFERILVDAPCSGTGVIRRHPDIKVLRRAGDLDTLCETQAQLLDALWPLLADRGALLYATCSYLQRENDRTIAAFLAGHPQAAVHPISLAWGRATSHGWQILPGEGPGEGGMDGFYYALLGKP